jgi:tRNA modification GTPase
VPVLFMDTAGIREAPGKVEREGIRRSLARAADADLVLWVTDGAGPAVSVPQEFAGLGERLVRVENKADLVAAKMAPSPLVGEGQDGGKSAPARSPFVRQSDSTGVSPHPNPPPQGGRGFLGLHLSALTGDGVEALLAMIGERAGAVSREPALITRARHRALIGDAVAACQRFLDGEQTESELRAEDLRGAAHALGKLTGRVDVEEVLGEIFGRFCIGK